MPAAATALGDPGSGGQSHGGQSQGEGAGTQGGQERQQASEARERQRLRMKREFGFGGRAERAESSGRAEGSASSSAARSGSVAAILAKVIEGVERLQERHVPGLQMRLDLGRGETVRLILSLQAGVLKTMLMTDSDGLKASLREGWDNFSRSLADRGIQVEQLRFGIGDALTDDKRSARDAWEEKSRRQAQGGNQNKTVMPSTPETNREIPAQQPVAAAATGHLNRFA